MKPEFILAGFLVLTQAAAVQSQAAPADPFAEGVRPTPWLSPADQQTKFKLPPGFEIQLVAAEPDINKPLNLAFDTLGRLWVTTSIEYPYAAPTNRPGRDRLMIFEDFGPDGRARKVTEFAGGLNIPIGIYPYQSPNAEGRLTWKAIVWSIPNIWRFEDTDGDGRADRREPLFGPFDHTRDTHGNQASFRRGFDGWLYATHGFNNDSHVRGRDGHQVDLNSGNSYRMRLDGSRLEQHTHGQVNPFGLAFDPFGNLFSSDCHSEPLYQLLAGGYYPSFGKPHDGLGFAPNMMEKMRGSTAIDGVSIYADNLWPAEFHGNLFFGDVMASRVMRDRTVAAGATLISKAMPDFVATDDPWFRPVDTTFGPDGAMYIADFYNRIIGHYEVPLTHPGRDRTSGRIWRVVYKDKPLRPIALPADLAGLIQELNSPSLTRRMLAMNAIADRFGGDPNTATAVAAAARKPASAGQQVHALWLLHRLNASRPADLRTAAASDETIVRVHAQRMAGNILHMDAQPHPATDPETSTAHIAAAHEVASAGLTDRDPLVQRCAAEALGRFRSDSPKAVRQLLDLRAKVPDTDTHLLYVVRKAIRDQLKTDGVFPALLKETLSARDERAITDVALAVPTADAATFLLRQLAAAPDAAGASPGPQVNTSDILRHAARYAPESDLPRLVAFASHRLPPAGSGGDALFQELERQFALFKSVDDGLQQRGKARPDSIRTWGTNLVARMFGALAPANTWTPLPLATTPTPVPWDTQTRNSTDGRKRRLTSSLPHGEALTGRLRSPDFTFPGQLQFWLCGHDGYPDKPAKNVNQVRLRAADTDEIIAVASVPRHDTARQITWSFPATRDRVVYVEAVDGDSGDAYAWLAFGDFEPKLPALLASEFPPRRLREWMTDAADVAVRTQMKETAGVFGRACTPQAGRRQDLLDADVLTAFAKAWLALSASDAIPGLSSSLTAGFGPAAFRENLAEILAGQNAAPAQAAVVTAMKAFPYKTQERLAPVLASARFSAETLLKAIEDGHVSPRVLQRVGVNNRLKVSKPTDWEARIGRLTKGLAPGDEARDRLLAERHRAFTTKPGQLGEGEKVFVKNCTACHRLAGVGALIGPQLDGIGQRGAERLCEDILDPNRNVDRAFRSVLMTLKDGEVVSGLFRREEGQLLVLADATGKEFTTPKDQVIERRESEVSLMPENFGELLTAQEFNDLLTFLMSKAAGK